VTKRLSSESNDAKRAGDEAGSLKRELAQLQGELNRGRQELYEAKERLRQMQADGDRHAAHIEGQAAEMSQQLVVSREGVSTIQASRSGDCMAYSCM
jgi:predicted  nucleic acid-binding Zn-ribbon protein